MNPTTPPCLAATAAFLLSLTPAVRAQGPVTTITALGSLAGTAGNSLAPSVSADGSTVVGISSAPTGQAGSRAFRWTAATGMANLGLLANADDSAAAATNSDGSFVVGSCTYVFWSTIEGFLFDPSSLSMRNLGFLPADTHSRAMGINGDGTVIVGDSETTPVKWSLGVINALPMLAGSNGYANCADTAGTTLAGVCLNGNGSWRAVRWTGAGIADLGLLTGYPNSWTTAISRDGNVIVGGCGVNLGGSSRAFRVVSSGPSAGVMQDLGRPSGMNTVSAECTNGDGSIVAGYAMPFNSQVSSPALWTAARGWIDVGYLLQNLNLNLGGMTLADIKGISADGSVIVGNATLNGRNTVYVLRNLPLDGFAIRRTGCDGLGITHAGRPDLGRSFGLYLAGSTTTAGFLIGTPLTSPLPSCGSCVLGASGSPMFTSGLFLTVPNNLALLGATFAFQGFDLFAGTCYGSLRLSDTVDVTIH